MSTPNLITRKDIAGILGDSFNADMVRKNEKRLGLGAARKDINKRLVRYRRDIVIQILTAGGYLPSTFGNVRK